MNGYTVAQLRQLAKETGRRGYSKLRKAELIEFIVQSTLEEMEEVNLPTHTTERRNLLDTPIPTHEIPKLQKILNPLKPAPVKNNKKEVDKKKKRGRGLESVVERFNTTADARRIERF